MEFSCHYFDQLISFDYLNSLKKYQIILPKFLELIVYDLHSKKYDVMIIEMDFHLLYIIYIIYTIIFI